MTTEKFKIPVSMLSPIIDPGQLGFEDTGPFSEDIDFIRRTQEKGLKIVKLKEATYRYRVDSDNLLCDLYERGGEKAILEFRGYRAGEHCEVIGGSRFVDHV